jgi:hypothetical protein
MVLKEIIFPLILFAETSEKVIAPRGSLRDEERPPDRRQSGRKRRSNLFQIPIKSRLLRQSFDFAQDRLAMTLLLNISEVSCDY